MTKKRCLSSTSLVSSSGMPLPHPIVYPRTRIVLSLGGVHVIVISLSVERAFKELGGSGTTDSSRSLSSVFSEIHGVAGPLPLTVMAEILIWKNVAIAFFESHAASTILRFCTSCFFYKILKPDAQNSIQKYLNRSPSEAFGNVWLL